MSKDQLNVRLEDDLMTALDETANNSGRTKTSIVSAALASYLNVDSKQLSIESLSERVNALESKIKNMQQEPRTKTDDKEKENSPEPPEVDPSELGELITKKEAAALTGYTVSTLHSTLSKKGIKAAEQAGGNREGKYSKQEIIDKIGFK